MSGVSKRVCVAMLTINTLAQMADKNNEWCIAGIVVVCIVHYISGLFKDRKNG
jgi:hypothetical protein